MSAARERRESDMRDIRIEFMDGTVKEFKHEGRAGGTYTKSVTYAGEFVVVMDEWGATTAFPSAVVREVKSTPHH